MLDQSQQAAVSNIARLDHRLYIITGAGGSGKTTTIKDLLVLLWDDPNNHITPETTYLAASTGKAAKVINDSFAQSGFEVDNEAKTIHRLLGFRPGVGWGYGVSNKLGASLVILDESSMDDSLLLSKVIDALPADCHLIMVGDCEQLPPVAPGQPFTDIINHGPKGIINRLTTNHRQAQGSLIAHGCLLILAGKMPTFGKSGEHTLGGTLEDDLFFLEEEDKEEIPMIVAEMCLPWFEGGEDFAILAPQKTGTCGVESMNKYLQEVLNPAAEGKAQVTLGWLTLRVGDKCLQTKNNYDLGVFNGFGGVIVGISGGVIEVDFDGEMVRYEKPEHIKQLTLGYAMTVHKSQGSEWMKGVVICHSSHYWMWSRSLLYTAVSRFRQELHVVGDKRALKRGLSNVVSGERQTLLKLRLQGGEVVA